MSSEETANMTARREKMEENQMRRVAIIIANCDYEESSGLPSLPGAREDLENLMAFLKNSYNIITIVNAKDIEAAVIEAMEGLPGSWLPVTHFQLVYLGIGPWSS